MSLSIVAGSLSVSSSCSQPNRRSSTSRHCESVVVFPYPAGATTRTSRTSRPIRASRASRAHRRTAPGRTWGGRRLIGYCRTSLRPLRAEPLSVSLITLPSFRRIRMGRQRGPTPNRSYGTSRRPRRPVRRQADPGAQPDERAGREPDEHADRDGQHRRAGRQERVRAVGPVGGQVAGPARGRASGSRSGGAAIAVRVSTTRAMTSGTSGTTDRAAVAVSRCRCGATVPAGAGGEDEPGPPGHPDRRRPGPGEPGQLPLSTELLPRPSCQPRAPAETAERA